MPLFGWILLILGLRLSASCLATAAMETADSGQDKIIFLIGNLTKICGQIISFTLCQSGRTGLVVRALDSGSGEPGSILGRVGVLFP